MPADSHFEGDPLLRKGVSALIVNSRNELLLVNLNSFEDHFFAVPGGGLDNNESTEEGIYREIKEELGISMQSLELVGICKEPVQFIFKTKKLHRNGITFDGSERYFLGFKFIGDDSEIKLQKDEVRSYKWVAYEDLKDYLLFDNQLEETQEKLLELFPLLNN